MIDDVPKPLLFDEIMTISLYGSTDEQEQLDAYLEEEMTDDLELEVFALAERIRERRQMWMRWRCCPNCRFYGSCVLKWIKEERNIPSICCFRCQRHDECRAAHERGEPQPPIEV